MAPKRPPTPSLRPTRRKAGLKRERVCSEKGHNQQPWEGEDVVRRHRQVELPSLYYFANQSVKPPNPDQNHHRLIIHQTPQSLAAEEKHLRH
jgi:hypothetical protein